MQKNNTLERSVLLGSIKGYLTEKMTVSEWDTLAASYRYPSSSRLIHVFGSWNEVKKALNLKGNRLQYTEEELIDIANHHISNFTTKRKWGVYTSQNNLPSVAVYIHVFGSWNKAKEKLSLPATTETNPPKYSKEDIKKLIYQHQDYMTSRTAWDEYVKGKELPTYKTIRKHFTWDEVLVIANKQSKYRYTEDQLHSIIKKEKDMFRAATLLQWNQFAKENNYPTSSVFLSRYGTWKKAKATLLKENE